MRLIDEVRDFLSGLRREAPELFRTRAGARALLPADYLSERAEHWSAVLGVGYNKIRVKDVRSRWGSCSSLGNLNFNWRLLLAPADVADYVVLHELAHRLELNHSKRFWAIVSRHCPEHRARRRWLKENGAALMRHRPPTQLLRADATEA